MKKLIATLFGVLLAAGLTLAANTMTVQKGDSLGSIAVRYGTSVEVLQRLNGLKDINIRVGQVLRLPQASSVTVRSGDSLASLAARHGVSVAALRAANGLSGDRIRVGQELKLPSSNQSVTTTRSSTTSSNLTVTVQSGDSLDKIARRTGISVERLRQLNNLSSDSIRVGQVLNLSLGQSTKPQTSANTVTVKSGDTLGEIATRYQVSLEDIQKINNLSGNNIRVGQVLRLPSLVSSKPQTPANKPKPSSKVVAVQPSSKVVVVQAGDTLSKIAARNNVSLEDLRAVNNLSNDAIGIGDRIRLPVSSSSQTKPSVATVKPSPKPSTSSAKPKPGTASAKPNSSNAKPKPTVVSAKPSAATTKPKPNASSAKPTTANAKPTPKPNPLSAKPSIATKPAAGQSSISGAKPTVPSTVKPIVATKPNTNTRVIAPPPNLPNATGKVITVQPQAAAPKPAVAPKPSVVASTPKPSTSATPKPSVTVLPSITDPKPTAPVISKPSAPVVSKPPATPATITVTPRPSDMPSTLGFNEPLEAPEDASPIDPALESPFFDATAPEGKPTAPSDLVSEDIEIEIPANISAASVTPPTAPNAPAFSRAEKVLWPISGVMTSRFGWRRLGRTRFHTGVDLAAPTGTRVYAALSGKVEFAGWNRQGYGYLVIVRGWDNRQYYYGHNSRLLVKRGQWVRQGQVISRVGSTGFSTGPHLHFEIRVNNRARNPLAYLPRSRLAQASAVGR